MGAPATLRVKTVPNSKVVSRLEAVADCPPLPQDHVSVVKQHLRMLPVLGAAAAAATIAVFHFPPKTSFAIFCVECGMLLLSIAVTVFSFKGPQR
jgi:hypothetical protein